MGVCGRYTFRQDANPSVSALSNLFGYRRHEGAGLTWEVVTMNALLRDRVLLLAALLLMVGLLAQEAYAGGRTVVVTSGSAVRTSGSTVVIVGGHSRVPHNRVVRPPARSGARYYHHRPSRTYRRPSRTYRRPIRHRTLRHHHYHPVCRPAVIHRPRTGISLNFSFHIR